MPREQQEHTEIVSGLDAGGNQYPCSALANHREPGEAMRQSAGECLQGSGISAHLGLELTFTSCDAIIGHLAQICFPEPSCALMWPVFRI